METDILPASALVCPSENGEPLTDDDDQVMFSFEGNANGAVNLERYHERCLAAAGRLATRSPSIAYGRAPRDELTVVAEFDLLRMVFVRVIDAERLERWAGEPVSDFLPGDIPGTPTTDPAVTLPLCHLPMQSLAQGKSGIFAWHLMDGTILSKEGEGGPLIAWRPGDKGLADLLQRAGVDMARRLALISEIPGNEDGK